MANEKITYLYELIDKTAPGDYQISPGATEATLNFICEWSNLWQVINDILGKTTVATTNDIAGNPNLGFDRKIPLSHPNASYMYADSIKISGIKANGLGVYNTYDYVNTIFNQPGDEAIDYKTFQYNLIYEKLKLEVKFSAKNYFLITNEQLSSTIVGENNLTKKYYYYKRDKSNANGIVSDSYYDLREYLRYCEVNVEPSNEVIVNTTGKMYWKSESNDAFDPDNGPDDNGVVAIENAGSNYQNISKTMVKIKWYQIPKTIFQPTDTDKFKPWDYSVSMCNYGGNFTEDQFNFDVFNYNFFNYSPGTLLYLGYELEETPNPIYFQAISSNQDDIEINYMKNQYYNVTFSFMQFVIPENQIILPNPSLIPVKLGKMFSNGWNFVPSSNRMFYYCENDKFTNNLAVPPYWSFPFQAIMNPRLEIA